MEEEKPTGPEQFRPLLEQAADLLPEDGAACDFDLDRVIDALPVEKIIAHFAENRKPEPGDRCLVLEADTWLRGTIESECEGRSVFVCSLDDFTGEYRKTRDQISCDWEITSSDNDEDGTCPMCGRETKLTAHHLRPRQLHSQLMKKGFTREELNTCAYICRPCHSAVHRAKTNAELAKDYFTLDRLMELPQIQEYCRWASRQKVKAKYAL